MGREKYGEEKEQFMIQNTLAGVTVMVQLHWKAWKKIISREET